MPSFLLVCSGRIRFVERSALGRVSPPRDCRRPTHPKVPVTEHQLQSLSSRFGRLGDPDSVSYEDLFFFAQSAVPELSATRCVQYLPCGLSEGDTIRTPHRKNGKLRSRLVCFPAAAV